MVDPDQRGRCEREEEQDNVPADGFAAWRDGLGYYRRVDVGQRVRGELVDG
jgi:hypothetical protein